MKNLFAITGLKLVAAPMGISKIDAGDQGGRLVFGKNPSVDPLKIVELVQSEPQVYSLDGTEKFRFRLATDADESRVETLRSLLAELGGHAA